MPNEPIAFKPISGYDKEIADTYTDEKAYKPTFLEWLWRNANQIIKHYNGGTNTLLYTVPEGYNFYLTNSWLTVSSFFYNGTAVERSLYTSDGVYFIKQHTPDGTGIDTVDASIGISNNYTFPLVIKEGIKIYGDTTNFTGGNRLGFAGFLVKKDLIYK